MSQTNPYAPPSTQQPAAPSAASDALALDAFEREMFERLAKATKIVSTLQLVTAGLAAFVYAVVLLKPAVLMWSLLLRIIVGGRGWMVALAGAVQLLVLVLGAVWLRSASARLRAFATEGHVADLGGSFSGLRLYLIMHATLTFLTLAMAILLILRITGVWR